MAIADLFHLALLRIALPGWHPRVRHRRRARADPAPPGGLGGAAADGRGDVLPMGDLGEAAP